MAVFWVVALIMALMMEAASTSEISVNFCQTTCCNIPEDSHLHTHRSENLKSYINSSTDVTRVMKSRTMRWAGDVARIVEMRIHVNSLKE
jgi:hypothetical protein